MTFDFEALRVGPRLAQGLDPAFWEACAAGQSARGFRSRGSRSYMPSPVASAPSAPLLTLVRRFGADAMSFLAFESTMKQWSGASSGSDTDAIVSFADTGTAWIAAGRPLAEASRIPGVAMAFVQSAREKGRRACFFATESPEVEGFSRLLLGEQPVWDPATWPETVVTHRRLREQIRRPKGQGSGRATGRAARARLG